MDVFAGMIFYFTETIILACQTGKIASAFLRFFQDIFIYCESHIFLSLLFIFFTVGVMLLDCV